MSPRVRRLLAVGGVLSLLLLASRSCLAEMLVRFQAPHAVRAPAARLDHDLLAVVDTDLRAANIGFVSDAVRFSLSVTGARLHFGLGHETTLAFDVHEREGNCIEYAHLFAAVFNRVAEKKHMPARAYVVHSEARVLGRRLPHRGLGDHDWVLVVPTAPAAQPADGGRERVTSDIPARGFFVDPTFHDLGLDWDISRSVSGDVRAPSTAP